MHLYRFFIFEIIFIIFLVNKMTTKTKKNTKTTNNNNRNTKRKLPKNIEKKINEIKKLQLKLNECIYSNCKSISKQELTDMMAECKKKTEHIKSIIEKTAKKQSCMIDFFIKKGDKLDEFYKCSNDKCSIQNKKSISKALELSNMINPDMKKIKGLRDKAFKLSAKKKECYNTQCKNIFPNSGEVFNNCFKQTNKITGKAQSAKLKECLKTFNYDKKIKELNKCEEEKCKPTSDKLETEIKAIYDEIITITNKTTELAAKYAEYMPEKIF